MTMILSQFPSVWPLPEPEEGQTPPTPMPAFITTESGIYLTTESGEYFITEQDY